MLQKRTDLALEAKELFEQSTGKQTEIEGVQAREINKNGVNVTTVKVLNEHGAHTLGKPVGCYVTISFEQSFFNDSDELRRGAAVLKDELIKLVDLKENACVLVAGLGNNAVTPDALGPQTVKNTVVTRHLSGELSELFGDYRPVAALETGVLGTTGIESAQMLKAVADRIKPDCVIVVDALATCRLFRICSTVQISNTGIIPGSGVGNSRAAINEETIGVPIIAIGVPTVVDVGTLCADIMEQAGFGKQEPEELLKHGYGMIVTPRDIDAKIKTMARLISTGINLALHSGMELKDIDWFLNKI